MKKKDLIIDLLSQGNLSITQIAKQVNSPYSYVHQLNKKLNGTTAQSTSCTLDRISRKSSDYLIDAIGEEDCRELMIYQASLIHEDLYQSYFDGDIETTLSENSVIVSFNLASKTSNGFNVNINLDSCDLIEHISTVFNCDPESVTESLDSLTLHFSSQLLIESNL